MKRAMLLALLLLAACKIEGGAPATAANPDVRAYTCPDGATLAAEYGKDGDADTVRLTYDGNTYLLYSEPAGSGVRYGWPSDGSNYVWWTKGDQATLYWKDGEKGGEETVLHADCTTG